MKKLALWFNGFLIVSFLFLVSPVKAEYYLVYSSDCCCETIRDVPKKQYCSNCKPVAKKKYHHKRYAYHKPKSSYHISVYYVWNGFPNPCPSPCEVRYCCGSYQRSSGSIVKFSGAPAAWPQENFSEGTNDWNYYQDRATADDVYPDMNVDN